MIKKPNRYPKGYWSTVFEISAKLIKESKLDGGTAFKLARNMVDESMSQTSLPIRPETLELKS